MSEPEAKRKTKTVAEFVEGLRAYPGVGGFLAAQIAADVKHFGALRDAPDVFTFALSGPGSRMGMNFLLKRKADAPWRKDDRDWYQRLAELHALVTEEYPKRGLPIPDFQDLQNQLCEFSKYWSLKTGLKTRLKREYRPAGEPAPPAKEKTSLKAKEDAGAPKKVKRGGQRGRGGRGAPEGSYGGRRG
jgi:hypothetical protein